MDEGDHTSRADGGIDPDNGDESDHSSDSEDEGPEAEDPDIEDFDPDAPTETGGDSSTEADPTTPTEADSGGFSEPDPDTGLNEDGTSHDTPDVESIDSGADTPSVSTAVDFDGAGSSDADGSIAAYDWSFGDGTAATGQTVSKTWDAAGDYTVTLSVTDDDGRTYLDFAANQYEQGTARVAFFDQLFAGLEASFVDVLQDPEDIAACEIGEEIDLFEKLDLSNRIPGCIFVFLGLRRLDRHEDGGNVVGASGGVGQVDHPFDDLGVLVGLLDDVEQFVVVEVPCEAVGAQKEPIPWMHLQKKGVRRDL